MTTTDTPTAAVGTGTELADRVASLRAVFRGGRTRDLGWRLAQLDGLARMLAEAEQDIVRALDSDLGRAGFDAWLGDIASTAAEITEARGHLRSWARPRRVGMPLGMRPGRAWYQYEPLGVVLVIGPWNYPLYLTLGPLVGALAAGNCAIVKPSEHAPATSRLLAELLPAYVDPEAVAVVEGAAEETRALLDEGLDHVLFTGGARTGRAVMEAAARHLTPVTLELGGKCPAIVTRHADLEVAGRRIVWGKLLNSGQTCIAPDYVLVEDSVREPLLDSVRRAYEAFTRERAPLRIVNEQHTARLAGLLKEHGGEVRCGGGADPGARSVDFTVVVDPDPDSELMREEIFGPVLPVLTVDSLDAAVDFVVQRPKPLATYLFSNARAEERRVLAEISAGGVTVNHVAMHALIPRLPFGGVGHSGIGAYHGRWGFETFSHRKAVLRKPARPDLRLAYPPYTARAERLLRRLF
ncbi:aldehyde dehydrogenase family protein [Streptomyces fuscichromogenes]|uniref:aldehyde dehydrogenase family protein n=1 Tax=Streptomyces fuscichromogenes TaxID=1324013 RepID=UPI00382ABF2A